MARIDGRANDELRPTTFTPGFQQFAEGSVLIHQDARVYAGLFNGGESASLNLGTDRLAYVHVARGALTVNGTKLNTGDGLKIQELDRLTLENGQDAEVLVFDLRAD